MSLSDSVVSAVGDFFDFRFELLLLSVSLISDTVVSLIGYLCGLFVGVLGTFCVSVKSLFRCFLLMVITAVVMSNGWYFLVSHSRLYQGQYIYRERERHTRTQTDRQTDRKTGRKADRETDRGQD